jgi:hypothetical protein
VDVVALEQRRDATTVLQARRDMQEQVTMPERLVIDREGRLVVTELLKGAHNAGSQSVVAAPLRIQDPCSLLTAQDLHRGDIDPGPCEFPGKGRDLRLLSQQAHHSVGGPVMEVIDVDLRLVHVTTPGRAVPGTVRKQCPAYGSARRALCRLPPTDQLGRIA